MKLTIQITADDIAQGMPDNCSACPVALAVNRALHGWWASSVGKLYVTIVRGRHHEPKMADLPTDLMAFIRAFDAGAPLPPLADSYTLEFA